MAKAKDIATVDCDGVILNFLHQYEVAAREILGREISQQSHEYDLSPRYGITPQERDLVLHHFASAGHWGELPDLDGAVDAIKTLIHHGLDVHVVTAIDPIFLPARIINFSNVGMPDVPVHAVTKLKLNKLRELRPVVFFDDNDTHLYEAKEAGVPVIYKIPNHSLDVAPAVATHFKPTLHEAVSHFLDEVYPAHKASQSKKRTMSFV